MSKPNLDLCTKKEFVDTIRKLVLQKLQYREIMNKYVFDVATARYFNQKIIDCNWTINKLLKEYMGS